MHREKYKNKKKEIERRNRKKSVGQPEIPSSFMGGGKIQRASVEGKL